MKTGMIAAGRRGRVHAGGVGSIDPAGAPAAFGGRIAARLAKRFESSDANGDVAGAHAAPDANPRRPVPAPETEGEAMVMRDELQGFFRRGG